MDLEDPWLAADKLHHFLLCFFLTLLFFLLASRSRYSFLRNRSVFVGSFLSLSVGAAKEAADHLGYFQSSGASLRDAVADAAGVMIACVALSLSKLAHLRAKPEPSELARGEVSIV